MTTPTCYKCGHSEAQHTQGHCTGSPQVSNGCPCDGYEPLKSKPLEGLEEIRARWTVPPAEYGPTNSVIVTVIPNVAAQAVARQALTDVPRLLRMIEALSEMYAERPHE